MRGFWLLIGAVISVFVSSVSLCAQPPVILWQNLQAGISVTHWFRFPPSFNHQALRNYLTDAQLQDLHHAGFTNIRLPIQPASLWHGNRLDPSRITDLIAAIHRINAANLVAIIAIDPTGWQLDNAAPDRQKLLDTWHALSVALIDMDSTRYVLEILNEPVFTHHEADWENLQNQALGIIRQFLPAATIMLTGADWGGIDGLVALHPVSDPNVIYSFHFYEPSELTALTPYRQDIDHHALTALPFPVTDIASCRHSLAGMTGATHDVADFYCAMGWNADHIKARFDQVVSWSKTCAQQTGTSCAIMMGEFGATTELPPATRLNWILTTRKVAAERGFGWVLWGYDDIMGFDSAHHHPLDSDLLQALGLARP